MRKKMNKIYMTAVKGGATLTLKAETLSKLNVARSIKKVPFSSGRRSYVQTPGTCNDLA